MILEAILEACISQLFLIVSSRMQFQTMPSKAVLFSVFRLALKIFCSAFNYLYLFERIFSSSFQRGFSCSFGACLCYTLEGLFQKKVLKKQVE